MQEQTFYTCHYNYLSVQPVLINKIQNTATETHSSIQVSKTKFLNNEIDINQYIISCILIIIC